MPEAAPLCDKLPRGFKCCRAFVALADVGSKTISRSWANLRVGVRVLYRISSLDEPESKGPTWCACPHQSRRLYTRSCVRVRHSPTRTIQSHGFDLIRYGRCHSNNDIRDELTSSERRDRELRHCRC